MFMQKFGLSQKNFDFEQARNLLHNALDCEDYREDKRIGKIVVASSGMCDKGKVTQILPEILKDPNSCVILSGYQAEGSNGWYLKNFKDFPEDEKYNTELDFGISDKKIRIKLCDVKCKIYDFSKYYSGHADQNVLSEYAHGITSKVQNYAECTVFLNHGKDESREALKEKILQMNNDSQCVDEQGNYSPHKLQVVLPKAQVWYTLSDSSCDVSQQEIQKNVENRICPVSEEERKFFETMPKKAVNYGKKSFTIEDIEVFYPENFTNEQVDSLMNAIRNSLL